PLFCRLEIQRYAQVPARLAALFPVSLRHAFTPVHRGPVAFADTDPVLDVVPVPRRHQDFAILLDIMPALDEDPFAVVDAAAALVADRITHFISVRAPDLFTNCLIHRLAPHLLTLGELDRIDPDLIANRAIGRLDPH